MSRVWLDKALFDALEGLPPGLELVAQRDDKVCLRGRGGSLGCLEALLLDLATFGPPHLALAAKAAAEQLQGL